MILIEYPGLEHEDILACIRSPKRKGTNVLFTRQFRKGTERES